MLAVVQFFHPGPEHKYDKKDNGNILIKEWNSEPNHRRKFMMTNGSYIENNSKKNGELLFWGEWEPPSIVESLIPQGEKVQGPEYPRYLHYPFMPEESEIEKCQKLNCQNTDPFVFGDAFRYSNCRQAKHPGSLGNLDEGSLILFGSRVNFRFALDTVFVVKKSEPYTIPVNNQFEHMGLYNRIVLKMLHNKKNSCSRGKLVLYSGAVHNNNNEMFSFVPAKKYDGKNAGFPRFVMPDDFYKSEFVKYFAKRSPETRKIVEMQNMNIKFTPVETTGEIKLFWEYLKNTISKNYVLGVNFKMPEYKNAVMNR